MNSKNYIKKKNTFKHKKFKSYHYKKKQKIKKNKIIFRVPEERMASFANFTEYMEYLRMQRGRLATPNMLPHIYYRLSDQKKIKMGLFLKKPVLNTICYPFPLNLKLVSEFINKK